MTVSAEEAVAEVAALVEAWIDEAAAKGFVPPLSEKHRAEFTILKNWKKPSESGVTGESD